MFRTLFASNRTRRTVKVYRYARQFSSSNIRDNGVS